MAPKISRKAKKLVEREERLAIVARMDRRGCTQRDIAKATGVTQQQIAYDLKKIHKDYANTYVYDHKLAVAVKLQQLYEVRAEAWEAWERSKRDTEKLVEEKALREARRPKRKELVDEVLDGLDKLNGEDLTKEQKLKVTKVVRTIEGRLPNNEYLLTIVKCLEQEAELEGLLEADTHIHLSQTNNIQHNNTSVTVNWWDNLHHQPDPIAIESDPIEKKIAAIERKAAANGHLNGNGREPIEATARICPPAEGAGEEGQKAVG